MAQEKDYDIEAIKRLFFDPNSGGSVELRMVTENYIANYQQTLGYLNKHVPAELQREVEGEAFWLNPEKLKVNLVHLLTAQHTYVPGALETFFQQAQKLGMIDEYEPYVQDRADEYSYEFADALARHYAVQVQIAQAAGRKYSR